MIEQMMPIVLQYATPLLIQVFTKKEACLPFVN
jgi:hypothetical protein